MRVMLVTESNRVNGVRRNKGIFSVVDHEKQNKTKESIISV